MTGKSLTPIQALSKFDSWRLSARIHNLIDDGFDIKMNLVTKGKKTFASYSLNYDKTLGI